MKPNKKAKIAFAVTSIALSLRHIGASLIVGASRAVSNRESRYSPAQEVDFPVPSVSSQLGRFASNNLCLAHAPFSLCLPVFHVIITRSSLLYHVRTWYISCDISSTTHPNQPTYTFNELQKRKRKRIKRGETKK